MGRSFLDAGQAMNTGAELGDHMLHAHLVTRVEDNRVDETHQFSCTATALS